MCHYLGLLCNIKVTVEDALGIVDEELIVIIESRILPRVEVEADQGDIRVRPVSLVELFTPGAVRGKERQNPDNNDCLHLVGYSANDEATREGIVIARFGSGGFVADKI